MNLSSRVTKLSASTALFVSLVFVLNGCADMQYQGGVNSSQAKEEYAAMQAMCHKRVLERPNIRELTERVRGKIPLGDWENISIEMLANPQIPTDEEVVALKVMYASVNECEKDMRPLRQKYEPNNVHLFETFYYKINLVGAELIAKKISYGNANRLFKEAGLEMLNKHSEQVQREMEYLRQQEMERRQAMWDLGNALIQADSAMRQQYQAPPLPRVQTTNCVWFGSRLQCTTY